MTYSTYDHINTGRKSERFRYHSGRAGDEAKKHILTLPSKAGEFDISANPIIHIIYPQKICMGIILDFS